MWELLFLSRALQGFYEAQWELKGKSAFAIVLGDLKMEADSENIEQCKRIIKRRRADDSRFFRERVASLFDEQFPKHGDKEAGELEGLLLGSIDK